MLTRFVIDYLRYVAKGGPKFYAWMGMLGLLTLAGPQPLGQRVERAVFLGGESKHNAFAKAVATVGAAVAAGAGRAGTTPMGAGAGRGVMSSSPNSDAPRRDRGSLPSEEWSNGTPDCSCFPSDRSKQNRRSCGPGADGTGQPAPPAPRAKLGRCDGPY